MLQRLQWIRLGRKYSKHRFILARLDETALKPNPLTDLDCVDQFIKTEKQNCKPGYMKQYLEETI